MTRHTMSRYLPDHCRSLVLALAGLLGAALLPATAAAHPHVWADISVTIELDEQGRVEALRQRWRLDPFYSLMLLEELKSAEGEQPMEARLDQLGSEIRSNLAPKGYFTEVRHAGEPVALDEVTEYTTLARDDRVAFHFRLPLVEPLPLDSLAGGDDLRYRIYDPSYYIEMIHEINEDQTPRDDALVIDTPNCTTRIIRAEPDPEMVAKAAQLDRTDEAPEGLGRFFAETGEVSCSSS
ncbi:DUF1007 family protein [Halomonas sp. 18H]|uniref:DUF1007 family protein n=1 Tax=Halomonas almeriensis TaxID=308163 RepID=UPI00222F4F6D|nr:MULTISPECIES: DUF1007 family protein [Halomonas]MCW4149323.1 DUF1007 family protein [Halomonas sp. 18H]MDN3553731.1 DUF1007 family protein [Halomonas almeriensis]